MNNNLTDKRKEKFIEQSKSLHKNKFNYDLVVYKNNKIKVKIVCPEHGEFLQRPNDHLSGYGCKKCQYDKLANNVYSNEKFIILAKEKHDNKYDYSQVNYTHSENKIEIICKKHGVFKQTPHNHLNGNGCPNCRGSKGESIINKVLIENNIKFEIEVTFNDLKDKSNLYYDFYLPKYKLFIEFHGIQHTKPVDYFGGKDEFDKLRKRDIIKYNYAVKNGYLLLTIWNPNINTFESDLINCLNERNIL